MALDILLFDSDIKLEGVTNSPNKPSLIIGEPAGQPSLVISQRWFDLKEKVTLQEIRCLLEEAQFRSVPGTFFGWFRKEDGVVIMDAKPDNFIRTSVGLVPIDLQLAQFTQDEMKSAGLIV